MKTTVLLVALICLALIGGAIVLTSQNKGGGIRSVTLSDAYNQRVQQGYWSRGNTTDPKIKLTEYCDFQSPSCAALFSIIEPQFRTHSAEIEFDWHTYLVKDKYNNSAVAAATAEAAGRQGKFWDMYQLLYVNQQGAVGQGSAAFRATVISYAQSLQLNMDQFKSDLDDISIMDAVNKDITIGDAKSIPSTPALLLNGDVINPVPSTAQDMDTFIKNALQAAK